MSVLPSSARKLTETHDYAISVLPSSARKLTEIVKCPISVLPSSARKLTETHKFPNEHSTFVSAPSNRKLQCWYADRILTQPLAGILNGCSREATLRSSQRFPIKLRAYIPERSDIRCAMGAPCRLPFDIFAQVLLHFRDFIPLQILFPDLTVLSLSLISQ